jgi:hypothetical protein
VCCAPRDPGSARRLTAAARRLRPGSRGAGVALGSAPAFR